MPEFFAVTASDLNAWTDREQAKVDLRGYQVDATSALKLWSSFSGRTDEEKIRDCMKFMQSLGLQASNACGKIYLMVKNKFLGFPLRSMKDDPLKAVKLFGDFIEDFIRQHEISPAPLLFYHQAGLTPEDFIVRVRAVLQWAKDDMELVVGLNSIIPQLGETLFSQWLLSQREIKASARLYKMAYLLKKRLTDFLGEGLQWKLVN